MSVYLYNATVRVVDLVWAKTEEEALTTVSRRADRAGFEVLPDGRTAFVSEAVPERGWDG